jgi:hypothetical protein
VGLSIAALLCAACRHTRALEPTQAIPSLAGATHVYTQTNLHPDEQGAILYSGNFQQAGLIPICSEVTLEYASAEEITFKVNATGKEYGYYPHNVAVETLLQNAGRYFGPSCPQAKLDQLTPVEKEGVRLGVPKKGMRKEAVILACGYPPLRDTPSTDMKTWRYWTSRWVFFTVDFDANGVVEKVTY